MRTASQILESKGYDLADQNEIVNIGYLDHQSLDQQVRTQFGITEPIHLWDGYYIGDAGEDTMNEIAQQKGYEDYKELLAKMDNSLVALAEAFPVKKGK